MENAVPKVPPAVAALEPRKIPRWGPTIGSASMFIFMWVVFGSAPTYGLIWALVNDTTSVFMPMGVVFGLPLDLLIGFVVWRMMWQRGVIKRGALACCPISEMTHTTRHGSVLAIHFRYQLALGGASYKGKGLVREIELRGLPAMPTNLDFAIVAYDPARPKRNCLFGFAYQNGAVFAPGLES